MTSIIFFFFKYILLCRVLPGSQFDDYTQKYKQDMYYRYNHQEYSKEEK